MTKQFYSYALDSTSRLIKADLAQKGNDFFCPSCGAIMVLRKGEKNRPHFAHKANVSNCSYETYLHKLAKRRISECFNNSPEFKIAYQPIYICNKPLCPWNIKNPCSWRDTAVYDLKKYYNQCIEEVTISKFRADLVLINNQKSIQPIIIEICVTHKSTEEKLNSGYHIIELKIESEQDINDIISSSCIKECSQKKSSWYKNLNSKIRFHNFRTKILKHPDKKHSGRKFFYSINSNGLHFEKLETCLYSNPPKKEDLMLISHLSLSQVKD